MTLEQKNFLQQYLSALSDERRQQIPKISAEYFCADEKSANDCAQLISRSIKTATSSLKAAYDVEDVPLPQVGNLTIVLDWAKNPICIIETTAVSICPFNMVDAEFAFAEGENDCSLLSWRNAHWAFFTNYAQSLGIIFQEKDELVLERFKKVFPL